MQKHTQQLFIVLTFIVVAFSLNNTHVRSHIDVSDENIKWGYSGPKRSWQGNVQEVFSYHIYKNVCRKYTIRKSTWDNRDWVEIGINHNCYCWFSCLNRYTLVMPGDPDWMKQQSEGKWCYGKQVKDLVTSSSKYSTLGLDASDQQARNAISDLCAQATQCQERCS